jgi:dinuclear metal center YbgI/SA1388 family protein
MDCADVCDRLDAELATAAYADIDASANGLQVGPGESDVDHAAFAVDAARATIEAAADAGADLLVAHHGLIWGGIERVTDSAYARIESLVENDLALYVSHLPDGHQELGNAAGVADLLDLRDRAPFGDVGGEVAGQRGRLPEPMRIETLRSRLSADLDTGDGEVRALDFGPDRIQDVAVLTGSGTDWLDDAVDAGADVLVTGEGKQQAYHDAREAGIHVVLAGHYATETFGVRSLRDLAEDWGLETTFVDHPTGL